MRDIIVNYNGDYPTSCMGTLKITVDGKEIYNKDFCCHSTGSVWFDDDWMEHVEDGELIWNDKKKFPKDVRAAVEKELSKVHVCCGGCV